MLPGRCRLNERADIEVSIARLRRPDMVRRKSRSLPAPHQIVVGDLGRDHRHGFQLARSLAFHAWVTLSSTLLGFALRYAAGDRACRHHHPQRRLEPLADAVDHRQPDGADPRHRADDRGRARRRRHHRPVPQGADLDVSELFPGRCRHGQGPAIARSHPARPDAHLQRQPRTGVHPAALADGRALSCSPR